MSNQHKFWDRVLARRKAEIEREWRGLLADADHWNRTHPNEEPIIIAPISVGLLQPEEIAARNPLSPNGEESETK